MQIYSGNGAEAALLAGLLDQSHECIKLLDSEGRILFVNREGCRAMELSTPAAVLGDSWVDRWPKVSFPIVEGAIKSAKAGEVARFSAARPGPHGEDRWWDVTLTPVAGGGAASMISIARDITTEVVERERASAINAEMRHRLRNGMTIAAGIVMLEARGAKEHRGFAQTISERFSQLARVQELVLDPNSDKSLSVILHMMADVYGGGSLLKIGEIPDVQLNDVSTQALALTFGELATNSLKYGALRAGEPIEISADLENTQLCLTWREPTEVGTARLGSQGVGLVDRLISAAKGEITRHSSGGLLIVRVTLPAQGAASHSI